MDQKVKTLGDYLVAVQRYKGRMTAMVAILLALSLGIAFGLPPVYRSAATILIEQQEIPQDLVRSTITSFADQRIQTISQRVMTRSNLMEIIRKYNLYPEDQKHQPTEVLIEQMRDDIKMNTISADVVDPRSGRPTLATIAFTVSYDSQSPALAQKVANELVSLYLNENLKSRTEMVTQTSGFISDEADKLSVLISELERKLADFKSRNVGELPELSQLNLQMMDRTERELLDVERETSGLKERAVYLETQLALLSPTTSMYTQTGERILGPADRLKQLQTKYLSLAATYGAEFPDVVRTRKEIDALKKEVGAVDTRSSLQDRRTVLRAEWDDARGKYAADHPDVKRLEREVAGVEDALSVASNTTESVVTDTPDNPAYIQLQSQLQTVQVELAVRERKQRELTEKFNGYEQRMLHAPQVERRFRELSRDYDSAWVKYKDLKAKEMEAQLSQVMETERRGERFTLIEPPELSEKPLKPNRMAILFVGAMFSMAGGLGTAAVSDGVDATVRGARGVSLLTNLPPLVSIPYIETDEDKRRRRRRRWIGIVAFLSAGIGAALAVHFLYMPLDVLWFVAQRRLGIF